MIGRFSQLGVYRELVRSRFFYRVAFAGALALASYLWDRGTGSLSTVGMALALASVALNGAPIIWGAVRGLLERKVNVDELVSLAIVAALLEGEFLTAAVVSFVMVLGALIEQATSDSARKAIQSLITLSPETATVLVDGRPEQVSAAHVRIGNILLVRPGERIPVDGVVREGLTAVDESSMTGEPIPQEKTRGDVVYAGSMNQNGVVEIEASRVGEDTTLGRVIKLVSEAEVHKPEAIRLIDRYARWFTPAILGCAALAWALTGELSRAVTILIVGCPCALILAAPTAIVASLGRAAKSGILVKGGRYLEDAGRADTVLFDKTGTLTQGKPRVEMIVAVDGVDEKKVLEQAASIEQNSTHPLAQAVIKAAHYAKISIVRAEEIITEIGLGVRGVVGGRLVEVGSAYLGGGTANLPEGLRSHLERFKESGATPLIVYEDQRPLGILNVSDQIRPAAAETVKNLKALGIKRIGMLSGDHEKSARLVADSVGVTQAWSGQKPEEKLRIIREFQASGDIVIFVGDGINDAPALAAAHVGIAMGAAGTDVALETADIALMNDDISKIPFLIELSRRMLRTIQWNVAFGMVFNAVAVLASGGGLLSPIMGAVVHNLGSVIVVISSASIAFASE